MRAGVLIALAGMAAVMPPVPRAYQHAKGIGQGAGAAALIARRPIAKPKLQLAVPSHSLVWDWTPDDNNPASNVVFLVESTNVLVTTRSNWPVVAVTSTNTWPLIIDKAQPSVFFIVQASNVISGAVSQ